MESALAQDWPQFEVVVADDASTDNSHAILKDWAVRDERIRLYWHSKNRGCAAARNLILSVARGVFVAFFDDDDVSCPERLRVQYERIIKYENENGASLVACYTSGTRYYPNGYEMPLCAIGSSPVVPVGTVLADYLLAFVRQPHVFYGNGTPTCSLMARTETFREIGGFDESFRRQEDADFAVRLAFQGGHFIGTPEPLLQQFSTTGSEKSAEMEHESLQRLLHKNRTYLCRKGLYDYMLGWSTIRYHHFKRQPFLALLALLKLGMWYPLRTIQHFIVSGTRRYCHERRMQKRSL